MTNVMLHDISKMAESWKKSEVELLVNNVKDHPILWNCSHPLYPNRSRKYFAWKKVAEALSTLRPGITEEEVRKKWNTLRNSYMTERRKEVISIKSGEAADFPYTSPRYYYEWMAFLNEPNISRKSTLYLEDVDDHIGYVRKIYRKQKSIESRNNSTELEKSNDPLGLVSTVYCESKPAILKKCKEKNKDPLGLVSTVYNESHSANEPVVQERDEIVDYGTLVTARLQNLDEETRLTLMAKYDQLYYEARRGRLVDKPD